MFTKKGFTFVELAIVIAILGLIFALGYPNYRVSKRTNQLYAQARNLSMDIRWIRELSEAHQSDTKLNFENFKEYKIYRENELLKSVTFEAGIERVNDGVNEITCRSERGFMEDVSFTLTNLYEEIKVTVNTSGKVDVQWVN